MNTREIYVEGMLESAKLLVANYSKFVGHAPKILRQSMMLAYTTAVDDMLKAMDHNKLKDPIKQEITPPVFLLDQNGNAS